MKSTAAITAQPTLHRFGRAVIAASLATLFVLAVSPYEAKAATKKLPDTAITSIQSSVDKWTMHPGIKLACKKVKGAAHYDFWVYKGTKATGKPYIKCEGYKRCPILSRGDLSWRYFEEKQAYTVKARAVKIGGNYRNLASWDESTWTYSKWSKPKTVTIKSVQYKIVYKELAGGTLPEGDLPATFTRFTPTFQLPVPTREGYVFDGWNAQYWVNIKGHTYYKRAYMLTEVAEGTSYSLELSAQWTPAKKAIAAGSRIL